MANRVKIFIDRKVDSVVQIRLVLYSHSRTSVDFGLPGGRDFCGFSIEEVLVCGVQSCSRNFVLRNENILHIN
jgi:hypothetical protein